VPEIVVESPAAVLERHSGDVCIERRANGHATIRINMEPLVTRADRKQTLDAEVGYFVSQGWRLRSATPSEAHLVKGEPVRHAVHVFFAIATLGLWLIVYIPLLIFGGEKHKLISVDEQGRVSSTDHLSREQREADMGGVN
jgi:hypothetical protein